MEQPTTVRQLTEKQANELAIYASQAFKPRTPITTRGLFAGRWRQIKTLADAISQQGLHVLIYGERGVGKTSLANITPILIQVFDEEKTPPPPPRIVIKTNATGTAESFSTIWHELFRDITFSEKHFSIGFDPGGLKTKPIREAFGLEGTLTIEDVRRTIGRISGAVFIIDEFDRAPLKTAHQFTDLIKSDFALDCTVILVGVSDTVDELLRDHASIARALVQIKLPRMEGKELREILSKAEQTIGVTFSDEAARLIVRMSQGLPHYTHLLGLHSVRRAAERNSAAIERDDVFDALRDSASNAQQSVTEKYTKATHSPYKNALYRQILLACALAATHSSDGLGYFMPSTVVDPLEPILKRRPSIATFNNHLNEFCGDKRGAILERTGHARAYRFRFCDPLLIPYVFMDSVSTKMIERKDLVSLLEP